VPALQRPCQHSNKAVIDCRFRPQCCHLESYFKPVDLQLVLLCTVYSHAQGCMCTALQLGGECGIIHKTGSTQRVTTPPKEDRSTAIDNMHKYLVTMGPVVPKIWSWTDRHAHYNTPLPYRGQSNKMM